LSDPSQRAGRLEASEESLRPQSFPLSRNQSILVVVVVTAACCVAVLISTPIDMSPFARSLVSPKASEPAVVKVGLDAQTPTAAVISWFAAVRTVDVPAVLQLTTASAQLSVGTARLRAAVRTVGAALGRPSVIQVEERGARASVHLLVLGYLGNDSNPVSAEPLLIELARRQAGWQINDVGYLISSADAIRALPKGG
jgi:hypothetical protein